MSYNDDKTFYKSLFEQISLPFHDMHSFRHLIWFWPDNMENWLFILLLRLKLLRKQKDNSLWWFYMKNSSCPGVLMCPVNFEWCPKLWLYILYVYHYNFLFSKFCKIQDWGEMKKVTIYSKLIISRIIGNKPWLIFWLIGEGRDYHPTTTFIVDASNISGIPVILHFKKIIPCFLPKTPYKSIFVMSTRPYAVYLSINNDRIINICQSPNPFMR